jgi:mono/diheme cytochrome c family protein
MKKVLLFIVFLLLSCINHTLQAQKSGEETFKSNCAACHTINKGRLVGPDLSGVYLKRKDEWLIRFIHSSQQFIKSGDTAAVAVYNKYSKMAMPDFQLSNEQINSVIEYIKVTDHAVSATAVKPNSNERFDLQYTPENISRGRNLFNGYAQFINGASPCMSCHNINDQTIMGGGRLAIDLTGSFLKLGPEGLKAILLNPPFPAMKTAMLNHDLTQNEVSEVISLLKSVAERNNTKKVSDSFGFIFPIVGFICAIFLLIHIFIFYNNRKIP